MLVPGKIQKTKLQKQPPKRNWLLMDKLNEKLSFT
jgi:hypothetical protein